MWELLPTPNRSVWYWFEPVRNGFLSFQIYYGAIVVVHHAHTTFESFRFDYITGNGMIASTDSSPAQLPVEIQSLPTICKCGSLDKWDWAEPPDSCNYWATDRFQLVAALDSGHLPRSTVNFCIFCLSYIYIYIYVCVCMEGKAINLKKIPDAGRLD